MVTFDGGLPRTGRTQKVSVGVDGVPGNFSVRMIGPAGEPVGPLAVLPVGDADQYQGELTLRDQEFRVLIEGKDAAGHSFQRVDARLFDPALPQ